MLSEVDGIIPVLTKQLEMREPVTNELRSNLSFIAALMLARVPNYKSGVERVMQKMGRHFIESSYPTVEALRASVEQWQREDPAATKDPDIEGMFRVLQNSELKVNPNEPLRMMLEMIPRLAESFFDLDMFILHASEDNAFLTCDRPLVVMPRLDRFGNAVSGVGIRSPGARKYLPLSSTIAVVFADQGDCFEHADPPRQVVRGVNGNIACMTDRFLIGRDKPLVASWAKRLRLAENEPIGGMDVF
jgi:hypothetical protein